MIQVRKARERGHSQQGWLDSFHTFSFADYHDPQHMGFRTLRVINEDRVQPGRGFGTHSHRDMEILTYVLEGALEHKDSMGNGSVIDVGDVQLMRAGTGVTHSEYNHSRKEVVHFLQIWIVPDATGLAPAYEQRHFPSDGRRNKLRLVASRDGHDGSLGVRQDVAVYATLLDNGHSVTHTLGEGRHAWLQVCRGHAYVNGVGVGAGDGAGVRDETQIEMTAEESAEILAFELG